MAKFAQNQILVRSGPTDPVQKQVTAPKTAKGAPIRGALQKTGADLEIRRPAAGEFLVTKAHVYAPSIVVEARNVVRCIVETSHLLVTL
jgi:hypothetical protein